jgi:invasion protein IalB
MRIILTSLVAAALAGSATFARAADAPTPAQVADPANLVVNEMIGDWTLRCFRIEAIAPCDILQLASQQETQQRVLLVSIAHVPSTNVHFMQIVVPLSVALAKGLTLAAGDNTLTGVKFSRCERNGCYVEIQVPEPTIQALTGMEGSTSITITAYDTNRPVNLPVSLNGFSQALTRLRVEARQRATNPPPGQQ